MIMSRILKYSLAVCLTVFISAPLLRADGGAYGSYTPYSIFGMGDMTQPGTAYNRSMGGVGIATRNHRFINTINPAAVTARDSLAFMADYSITGDYRIFRQADMKSASNTFNIADCVMSFPIWKTSAMMVGITPYSGTGYGYVQYETDPNKIGYTGNVTYSNAGQGSIYQVFAAAGVTFFKHISLGAEYIHYFGDIEKAFTQSFTESSYTGLSNSSSLYLKADSWKFGFQWDFAIKQKHQFCIGATYAVETPTKGYLTSYVGTDTTTVILKDLKEADKVRIPSEKGVGLSYRYADKFAAEFDYSRSDWGGSNVDKLSTVTGFTPVLSECYRAGFEYTPNRTDIRYYMKKVTYRAGAYRKNEYYSLNGNAITSTGITLGATFPVFKWYNGLTVAVDIGQRGSIQDNLIRERFINLSIGMNIFDIWFQKYKYD